MGNTVKVLFLNNRDMRELAPRICPPCSTMYTGLLPV